MPRLLASLFVTIFVTAGLVPHAAAQNGRGFFELPIEGGEQEYERLGLLPEERGIAIALLSRQIYGQGVGNAERILASRRLAQVIEGRSATTADPDGDTAPSAPTSILAPLNADAWRDVLELPDRADLFIPLLSNRAALFVCAGAMATDPSIRTLLENDRGLLRWLVRNAPAGFALAARSLRIVNGRVEVPGGTPALAVWEALALERPSRPADFIRAIVSRDGGRLAWFFDTLTRMDPERLATVASPTSLDQMRSLYTSFRVSDANLRIENHAFLRGTADAWMVSTRVAIHGGRVANPAWRWLWQTVFDEADVSHREATSVERTDNEPVTLSWLAEELNSPMPRERRDRFEMVRFAQTVFGEATESDGVDVLVAIGGYRRYRSALLVLDRMEIRAPALYARTVEASRRVSERSGREQRHALVAFQAALAIIERARVSRAIDLATAERLVTTLCDAVDRDAPVPPAVIKWITDTLIPALPPLIERDQFSGETTIESTIIQAMAGPAAEPKGPEVEWEGLTYRVDLAAGERQRIRRIREQLQSPGLDRAIALGQAPLLTEALLTLIYSSALGDPEGPALLSADVAQRHDFGLDAVAGPRRQFIPWLPPREQIGDGLPWHVTGSILGLDLGLARLALRRIDDNEMPPAPTINLNDEITLARTAIALNPRELTDAARDELVAAIARGRDRVAQAGHELAAVTELAREARLSAAILQALPWMAARSPESISLYFGLRELLWLGNPALSATELDRWGVYGEPLNSRLRTAMPPPAAWEDFAGRSELGLMGTQVPDLTLRLAQETKHLRLPAQLIPALLTFATLDYWHDVEARFPDDRPAMSRQALALSTSRVEDYVAALAGNGPLRAK